MRTELIFPRRLKCLGFLVGVKQTGEVQFFVRQYLIADPRVHQHRSYELASAPASTWQASQIGSIASVDTDLPGWIPASHSLFAGRAPEDAVYGYNPA